MTDTSDIDDSSIRPRTPWTPPARARNRPTRRPGPTRPIQPAYKVFTTEFDEVVEAEDLCDPEELTRA